MATTATASEVVFDASAVVRALVDHHPDAIEWLGRLARGDVRASCPDLLYIEVANAVLKHQRAGRLAPDRAHAVLESAAAVPLVTRAVKDFAEPAWIVANERGLSAYDACYVVLAETLGATLITADRRLAAATSDAVLISG